jgi:excisionase family DNA binding protein
VKTAEEHLTLRDAADALGISEVSARRWVKSGKLRAYQPGKKYLIPASAVEELLQDFRPPKDLGLLTAERALNLQDEVFVSEMERAETNQLHKLLAELVGDDVTKTKEDLKAGREPISQGAFMLALVVRAELLKRGEDPPERQLPAFRDRLEALCIVV